MSQEQRDSYVIPPNFIEGGSFFGGLFKARNVVEAVILAAGTGLPILTLSLTLTVRIILLCVPRYGRCRHFSGGYEAASALWYW